jgi:hypothetical protein
MYVPVRAFFADFQGLPWRRKMLDPSPVHRAVAVAQALSDTELRERNGDAYYERVVDEAWVGAYCAKGTRQFVVWTLLRKVGSSVRTINWYTRIRSINQLINQAINLSIYLSIYLSVYLSILSGTRNPKA